LIPFTTRPQSTSRQGMIRFVSMGKPDFPQNNSG
jgi:hypothetical protein